MSLVNEDDLKTLDFLRVYSRSCARNKMTCKIVEICISSYVNAAFQGSNPLILLDIRKTLSAFLYNEDFSRKKG